MADAILKFNPSKTRCAVEMDGDVMGPFDVDGPTVIDDDAGDPALLINGDQVCQCEPLDTEVGTITDAELDALEELEGVEDDEDEDEEDDAVE